MSSPALKTSLKGLNTSLEILKRWGVNDSQAFLILNISGAELAQVHSCKVSSEQLVRISYILNIHAALRTLLNNQSNVYGFMTMKNHSSFFEGKTPLSFIASGELAALKQAAEHLTALSNGN
ncbi:hypothetical protein L1D55_05845 [Vibrio sp. Isolate22]|uniref:hypothetical protein n=1 Tax=Vibrio sp. Isolate22 TaxID=2908532 RepID=UPI001EFC9C9F|nr:hypothetical protein [Vibrio sp. Isolate22]MCG9691283.1 hypothetical protein [Vibrio sp. Isolate22]